MVIVICSDVETTENDSCLEWAVSKLDFKLVLIVSWALTESIELFVSFRIDVDSANGFTGDIDVSEKLFTLLGDMILVIEFCITEFNFVVVIELKVSSVDVGWTELFLVIEISPIFKSFELLDAICPVNEGETKLCIVNDCIGIINVSVGIPDVSVVRKGVVLCPILSVVSLVTAVDWSSDGWMVKSEK